MIPEVCDASPGAGPDGDKARAAAVAVCPGVGKLEGSVASLERGIGRLELLMPEVRKSVRQLSWLVGAVFVLSVVDLFLP